MTRSAWRRALQCGRRGANPRSQPAVELQLRIEHLLSDQPYDAWKFQGNGDDDENQGLRGALAVIGGEQQRGEEFQRRQLRLAGPSLAIPGDLASAHIVAYGPDLLSISTARGRVYVAPSDNNCRRTASK